MNALILEWTLPLRLSSANEREHHHARARRVREQRSAASIATVQHAGPSWGCTEWYCPPHTPRSKPRPYVRVTPHPGSPRGLLSVLITRIGPRRLDSDNLAISAKAVRDGIAQALGVDDGDETAVRWDYAQERGSYGVRVRIERRRTPIPEIGASAIPPPQPEDSASGERRCLARVTRLQ